ncbi:MAG TPA: hypothetical protein VM754_13150 [Actinomycetota bacterium]|nr:hypothetical protein [Actinomycetota bacterium]
MADLEPQYPEEAGVDDSTPDLAQIEGAQLLATDAKPRLKEQGFTDQQIDEWTDAYVREVGAGSVEGFIKWVAEHQDN